MHKDFISNQKEMPVSQRPVSIFNSVVVIVVTGESFKSSSTIGINAIGLHGDVDARSGGIDHYGSRVPTPFS